MSKRILSISLLLGLGFLSQGFADGGQEIATPAFSSIDAVEIPGSDTLEETTPVQTPVAPAAPVSPVAAPVVVVEKPFSPFTGKLKRNKVRIRTNADLESRVVKELHKNDLLVVVGEKGDFYAVEPPAGTKAYVFRSFVLDGQIEGNRVNVRLEPSLDAPVIAHLNSGDRVNGPISSQNNKWYEITPPHGTRFYIAKEYIDSIGGPEVKAQLDKKRTTAEQLLDAATLLTQAEMKKSYREMNLDKIKQNYQTVINDYSEFPELADKAKEAFNALQEEYTSRKIAYLEDKADGKVPADEMKSSAKPLEVAMNPTDRMKMWDSMEESLYLSWASRNEDKSIDEFYEEQKQNAQTITGFVEAYTAPVKMKPGDFIIKNEKDIPVAYVYSTHINLQEFIGKKVMILASERPNNNFAFKAYFVLSVQ